MNEHHSPDAGSEYLYFSDNSEIAGTTIDGQSDRIFSSGIIPNEIAESVAESPAASTENPFKRDSDALLEGESFISVDQVIMSWEDNRPADLTEERTFGHVGIAYYDGIQKILARHGRTPFKIDRDPVYQKNMKNIRTELHAADGQLGALKFNDKQLITYMRERAATMAAVCEQREMELPPIIESFKQRLIHAATEQHLPIDLQVAFNKLDSAKVIFTDPYNKTGDFSHTTGLVRIGLTDDMEEVKERVFHELTHVISGYEVAVRAEPRDVRATRSGLRHHDGDKPYLRWLGESVTDKLSVLLRRDDVDYRNIKHAVLFDDEHRNPFYSFDELIMYELMTGPDGNVPFGNVVAAFTEDYDPHAAEGGRSVLQKELYARIAEAWRGFDTVSAIIYGELGMGVDRNKNYDTHYGMIYSFMNTRSRLIATAPFNQP